MVSLNLVTFYFIALTFTESNFNFKGTVREYYVGGGKAVVGVRGKSRDDGSCSGWTNELVYKRKQRKYLKLYINRYSSRSLYYLSSIIYCGKNGSVSILVSVGQ